ncbi:lectin-like protein [Polyangium sp. 6x1]|uniref:lectin-like protein n=1 Tax=Polyangium sp. 6x1 TaxID=3042689 RepID=UPI002482D55A|nr:lectin-like protein [Polyangium sp. 6x1]MDI1451053.1 lectin-like protein [Polyangium sp. 6x1]
MSNVRAFVLGSFVLGMSLGAWGCAAGNGGSGGDGGGQEPSSSATGGGGGNGGAGGSGEVAGGAGGDGGGAGAGGGAVCGDGILAGSEECDDANADPTDRCDGCAVKCLEGEQKWSGNNHCYAEFTAQKTNFANALQACATSGGYMVTVTSQAEQDFLFGTVIDKAILLPRWLGLTDIDTEGTFVWGNGEPLAYTHWQQNQPDDYNASEDCVEMYHVTGEWNDDNCTYEYHYVCEYAPPGL